MFTFFQVKWSDIMKSFLECMFLLNYMQKLLCKKDFTDFTKPNEAQGHKPIEKLSFLPKDNVTIKKKQQCLTVYKS